MKLTAADVFGRLFSGMFYAFVIVWMTAWFGEFESAKDMLGIEAFAATVILGLFVGALSSRCSWNTTKLYKLHKDQKLLREAVIAHVCVHFSNLNDEEIAEFRHILDGDSEKL